MQTIVVRLALSHDKIQYKLHVSKQLRKYFIQDQMYVQYESSIDLYSVPSSILVMPIVSTIAPIAWAVGANVHVPELDATYLESLKKVKDVYRSLNYPFSFSGDVRAEYLVVNEFGGERTCVLFSGGVDSLTSYLKHKQEKPDLISVWGVPDIPLSERDFWDSIHSDVLALANHEGLKAFQIKTDILWSINTALLEKEFELWWYPIVSNKLALPGLCAPITATRGIRTVNRASTATKDYKGDSASKIDAIQSWADVKVVHDCYELSRQDKLRYLCHEDNRQYLSRLRVCNDTTHARKINCGRCEKCMRTIVGLLVEGVNPKACNLDMDAGTLPYIRECFEKGKIALGELILFFWRDIQKHIPEQIDTDIGGSREFLRWLSTYDLSVYRVSRLRHRFWTAVLLLRNGRIKLPYIERKVKFYYYIILARLKLM